MTGSLQKNFLFQRLAKMYKWESINMGFAWLHAEGEIMIVGPNQSQIGFLFRVSGETLALFTEGKTQGKKEHQSLRFQKRREVLNLKNDRP